MRLVGDARTHTCRIHTHTYTHRCDRWQRRWRCLIMRCAACVFTATRACSQERQCRRGRHARIAVALLSPHKPPAPHATADAGPLTHGMDTSRARLHTRSSTKQRDGGGPEENICTMSTARLRRVSARLCSARRTQERWRINSLTCVRACVLLWWVDCCSGALIPWRTHFCST